jgi:enamine deaminase RidA (YjgF/YER057c/UK114 family)
VGAVEDRIAALGLTLPEVVPPVAAYVPAVLDGSRVYVSGQVPFVDGSLPATGRVGELVGLVSPETAKELAAVCALNAVAAIRSVVGDLDRVERIVKVTGFVASDPGFTGQPGVVNGASELLGEIFGEAGVHARSAVGVAALPLGAPVEVEVIAHVRD